MKIAAFFTGLFLITSQVLAQQPLRTKNLILVTIDGLRWQEVFRGADKALINSEYTANKSEIKELYWIESSQERRKALFPFLWSVVSSQGQLYGNRDIGNRQEVYNGFRFSYPGYNEILTGYTSRKVNSNVKKYNPNTNVLEYINQQEGFKEKVAAFTTWDTFPYILNDKRSGFPVSSGDMERGGDRPDSLTYQLGKTYLMSNKPRVLYLAFGETDDRAHSGDYHDYLQAATSTDQILADLWEYIQSDPFYKDQTTMIITSDHGRGDRSPSSWKAHGPLIRHSQQTWMAVIGPDSPPDGEMGKSETIVYQKQLAQTMARMLGMDFETNAGHLTGNIIKSMFDNPKPAIASAR